MGRFPLDRALYKETVGSPKFPSYHHGYMPWSQTPVVSCLLAMSYTGLLPSAHSTSSAFPLLLRKRGYPNDHNYTYFGAQYRACSLASPGFGLPLQGLPAGSAPDLLARLWSGGTFPNQVRDHPLGNNNQFHPVLRDSQGLGFTLARGVTG